MNSDLVSVFLLSLVAMFNPTLLAALTVMLLMPNPKRLMLGYLLGAYTTSIIAGLLIVLSLQGTGTENTARSPGNPIEDIALGLVCLTIAWVLRTGRDRGVRQRRQAKKEAKEKAREEAGKPTESLPLRLLGRGDPKLTFVVGALLSFPGVSYLDALDHIHKLSPGTAATVALILFFCLMQQMLLELPLTGYLFAPERTQQAVANFRGWMARSGRGAAVIGLLVIGLLLLIRGVATLA
jgi:Sap, sulfolipid-1-addressing protein